MPKDVLITPASSKIEFKDLSSNIDGLIQLDASDNLSITSPNGVLNLGSTGHVYIGDGINVTDMIFDQSGTIKAAAGKTLTIGASGSNVVLSGTLSAATTTQVTNLNSEYLGGYRYAPIIEGLRANRNISGGGTITVDSSYNVLWSARFIVISNGRSSTTATAGYWDINCPTTGTITGVGGQANVTATAAGIPLNAWSALYYILPMGSGQTSLPGNFRVASYTVNASIPSDWVLIAFRNGDDGKVYFNNGVVLASNESSISTQTSLNTANAVVKRDGSGNFSAGVVTGTRFVSTIATGTAPLTVSSSTVVTNLNADLIDGLNASNFLRSDVSTTWNGASSGVFYVNVASPADGSTAGQINTLQIYQATSTSDAFLTFHIANDYAAHFGLDSATNDLFFGGWSAGAVKNRVWHAGNKATLFTSPAFTGTPTAPTASQVTNNTQIATTAYVRTAVSGIVGGASYQTTAPTSPTVGQIWVDSDATLLPVSTRWSITASGGETTVSGAGAGSISLVYTPGYEQVYLNGVLLVRNDDYTANTGTSIVFTEALTAGDSVQVIMIEVTEISNTYTQAQIDAKIGDAGFNSFLLAGM